MYANNLESLLFELIETADVSRRDRSEMAERFDSLRRYGRLPKGRANRGALLTDEQIASAILGLASERPGWAGHVSLVLAGLIPVGGSAAAALEAATLLDAVKALIADGGARKQLIWLRISSAESGVNANGCGTLKIRTADGDITTAFQSALAHYDIEAARTFDHDRQFAAAAKILSLDRKFFERLARDTEVARRLKLEPTGDGSEYDREEQQQRRRKRLGVTPHSRYLMIGVDNQVTWPKEETLVRFDHFTLVLLPKTERHVQSISIDLAANRLGIPEARTVINRFLSVLTWCDDQFAVAQDGWAGNPEPTPVTRRNLAFTTTSHWLFDRKIPEGPSARALALYREGRNAEQNYLVSYAVLSYHKIIEIGHAQTNKWVESVFPSVEGKIREDVLREFHKDRGDRSVSSYLFAHYRTAVAHALKTTVPSDPDCANEARRLHNGAEIMRELARHFISVELKVSDSPFSGD